MIRALRIKMSEYLELINVKGKNILITISLAGNPAWATYVTGQQFTPPL